MNSSSLLEQAKAYPEFKPVKHTCPNCGHSELLTFFEVRNVPVHSCLMMSTQQEAFDYTANPANAHKWQSQVLSLEWSSNAQHGEDIEDGQVEAERR